MNQSLRKTLPAGAAVLMTLGSTGIMLAPTAFADAQSQPKLTAKQAEQIAMKAFSIPSSYTLQNESYNNNQNTTRPASYDLNYRSASKNASKQATGPSIQVTVNANTGTIINYYRSSQHNQFVFPVPVGVDKARAMANQWAKKLFPKQYGDVKAQKLRPSYGSLTGPLNYTFNYERMVNGVNGVNGIPAPFDGITIGISQNGHLTSVQDHWTKLSFPSAKTAESTQKADAIYKQALNLRLEYQSIWRNNEKPKTQLVYNQPPHAYPNYWGQQFTIQNMIEFPVIDAASGKIIDSAGDVYQSKSSSTPKPLVPGGPTWGNEPKKVNWTQKQALQYAQKILQIPAGYKLANVNENHNAKSDTTWNFSWQKGDASSKANIHVAIDATYGFLVSYDHFTPYQAKQAKLRAIGKLKTHSKLTQKQVDAKVEAFIKQVFPHNTGGMAVVPRQFHNRPGLQTSYQIVTFSNGIVNMTRSGNVSVNPQTGKIQRMYMNNQFESQTLADPAKAMSPSAAAAKWMTARPLKLEYLETQPEMAAKASGKKQTGSKAKVVLAYAPIADSASSGQFNAVTGKFESNGTKTPFTGTINDINGLKAAPQIRLLVHRELIPVDNHGDVHPNQSMTHRAFIKLLVDALGYKNRIVQSRLNSTSAMSALANVPKTSPASKEIKAAYSNGWIPTDKPFTPNATTTRDWAAQVLARALNMNVLLKHSDAFTFNPKDASKIPSGDKAGDALAVTLGLMSTDNGDFKPTSPMTLADSAVATIQAAMVLGSQGRPRPIQPMG